MRILRRFNIVGQDNVVLQNIKKLKIRQVQQLSLLEPLVNQTDKTFLNKTIAELMQINDDKIFNTFATRCLKSEIQSLNALADVNIERAFEKGHKKIPFTVKDHIKVEGMIETCGFADNLVPSNRSSEVVDILQKQNCIAFAHSNVPQGLLGIQSNNPVYGLSRNPHNPIFISGGSSGGQGALVAAKACSFGLGSDSGGSARIPAAFCGVYSFKPTGSKRLSVKGRVGPSGMEGIKVGDVDPSLGFLTRNIQDLTWLCQKTIGKSSSQTLYGGQWDSSRFQAAKRRKLKIGYIHSTSEMKSAPGIINTINETLQLLKSKNHKVIQFNFPDLYKFRNFFFQYVHFTNFLLAVYNRLQGHEVSSQLKSLYDLRLFGKVGVKYQKARNTNPFLEQVYSCYEKEANTLQFFKIHKEISELKRKFLEEWKKQDIDILISPVMPFTAPLAHNTELLVYQLTFCCFQNILQLPAGVIPTRLVKKHETQYQANNQTEKAAEKGIHKSQGLPLAIQITGEHLRDEECLGAMWQINKLVGHYIQPTL